MTISTTACVFLNIRTPELTGGGFDLLSYDNPQNSIPVIVKTASFFGEYKLGTRDVGGSCINYGILNSSDISDEC